MSEATKKVLDDAPLVAGDDDAHAEAAYISSGSYKREESRKKHIHLGGLVLFWFAILCVIAITAVWLFNWLTPDNWHFLDDAQRSQLQNFMIAGVGSTMVSDYAKRFLK